MAHKKALPGVLDLIENSISLYGSNWKGFVYIGLIPALFNIVANVLFSFVPQAGFVPAISVLILLITIVLSIAGAILQLAFRIALVQELSDTDAKKARVRTQDRYMESFGLVLSYIWACVLLGFSVTISWLIFIVPALILGVYTVLFIFPLVLENRKGLRSIAASYYYVKNNWWAVFGRFLGLVLVGIAVIGAIMGFVFALSIIFNGTIDFSIFSRETHSIASVILSIIFSLVSLCIISPIGIGYSYLIYKHLKALKSEPSEADIAEPVKWFKILAIIGAIVVPIAFIIIPVMMLVYLK